MNYSTSTALYSYVASAIYENSCKAVSLAFAATCKDYYQLYKTFLQQKPKASTIVSRLRDNQCEAVQWANKTLLGSDKSQMLFLQAYMSFGKTLVAYQLALNYLAAKPTHHVMVFVPSNIIDTWVNEAEKHMPSFVNGDRIVVYCKKDKFRKAVDEGKIKLKHLAGKIVISSSRLLGPNAVFMNLFLRRALIIVDEAHKMPGGMGSVFGNIAHDENGKRRVEFKYGPFLMLSATSFVFKLVTQSKLFNADDCNFNRVRHTMLYHKQNDALESQIVDFVVSAKTRHRHIVLISDCGLVRSNHRSWRDFQDFIDRLRELFINSGLEHMFYTYTGQKTVMSRFTSKGGVLVSSIQKISEGHNLNNCSLMFIINNGGNASFAKLQQCVQRVKRSSNMHHTVDVVSLLVQPDNAIYRGMSPYYTKELYVYAKLSVLTPTFGLVRKSSDVNKYIFEYLLRRKIYVAQLNDAELFYLFLKLDIKALDVKNEVEFPKMDKLKVITEKMLRELMMM